MKRLKLSMDALRVETFAAEESAALSRGTVRAHSVLTTNDGRDCTDMGYQTCSPQFCREPTITCEYTGC